MKKSLTLLAALFIITAGCSGLRTASSQDVKTPGGGRIVGDRAKQAEVMEGLRKKLLTSKPEEVGLSGEDAQAKVWGVLMDMSMSAGTATLVSVRDGTASLYTNTGGGILGGYSAREEAKAFVRAAEKGLAHMRPTKSFDYPAVGRIRFYVLTRDGVFTAEATSAELTRQGHALSPLFHAANDVLTQLRLATQKQQE